MTFRNCLPPPSGSAGLSLKEIFNRETAQAIKDFPQLEGRFVFIDAADDIAITHVDCKRHGFDSNPQELKNLLHQFKEEAQKAGSSLSTKLGRDQLDLMVYTPLPFKLFSGRHQPAEMEITATFDHELGHMVVKNAFYSRDSMMRETAADIFTALRHIQRYGDQSEAIDHGGWRRAYDFIFSGNPGHFTTPALDEVAKIADTLDVKAMTPRQTADLAGRLALIYAPHWDMVLEASMNFEQVRMVAQHTRDMESSLKALAEITLAEDAPFHTFKTGARCLQRFLDGKVTMEKGTPVALAGSYWEGVRKNLAARTAALDEEGLLSGMPLKASPKMQKSR